ncbi:histidine kinase [Solirubrobacter phytolaccae]|uniref:histidine kinase n=1 Tax=Solirubrobacter phytolaccae TaxID=1404360 RepID=A0A9X3N8S6_9ACTN|nr:histidine kinase [Solirubrobacter phytolaccae]MDA0180352.1 histidine kinase [Solirubrobacter phytolaccae]
MNRLPRHPLLADLLLTLVVLALGVSTAQGSDRWIAVALTLPLLWRRRAPFAVFSVIAVVAFGQWLAAVDLSADFALLIAIYTVAVQEPRGRVIAACVMLELGVVLAVARWAEPSFVPSFVLLTGMAVAAVVLGLNVRTRRAYLASVEDRAAQLERERDQQGRLGAAAERARIAREMHDIVAHNLSVMIALADGAGYMSGQDPKRAAGAMEQVSATGRHALGEMRRLLGVLREDDATALAPQPGLADLDPLLEQVRAAGLHTTLETAGAPIALGAGAELTVYRLVQEALTNTLKHAGADAHAVVRLRYDADGVEVEVTDDGLARPHVAAAGDPRSDLQAEVGTPRRSRPRTPSAGQGLTGMRERAAVYGGELEAGPAPDGGWRVRTRLGSAA